MAATPDHWAVLTMLTLAKHGHQLSASTDWRTGDELQRMGFATMDPVTGRLTITEEGEKATRANQEVEDFLSQGAGYIPSDRAKDFVFPVAC